jgi:hypothetical protein
MEIQIMRLSRITTTALTVLTALTAATAANSSTQNPSDKVLTNPLLDSACRNPYRMNFNFFASISAKPESGTQLALLANAANAEFCGTQISGIVNVARKDMNGTQIGSTVNIAEGRVNGVQISTINLMKNGDNAMQYGAINAASDSVGILQAGCINISNGGIGIMQAGSVNVTNGKVGYLQAGAINIAQNVGYLQIGAINIAADAKFQAGTINIAKKTSRRQIGVINIAGHSEKTPLGLINIIGNGIFELSYYVDTDNLMGISARTGTPWLYTLIEYVQPIGSLNSWPKAQGWGLGTRFGMTSPFYVNLDLLQMTFFDDPDALFDNDRQNDWPTFDYTHTINKTVSDKVADTVRQNINILLKARLGVNYAPIRYVTLSGGAYLNCLIADEYGHFNIRDLKPETTPPDNKVRMWLGAYVGVTVGISRWKK